MNGRHLAAMLVAAALLALPAASAKSLTHSGPYYDTIGQDMTDTHSYTSNAPGTACVGIYRPTTYTVTIEHVPPSDTLTITAGGESRTTSSGFASVSFVANYCTSFDIVVYGTDVENKAVYTVHVTSVAQLPIGSLS